MRANVVHIDLRHSDVVLDDKDVVSQIKRCVGFFPNLSLLHSLQSMSEKIMAISSRGVVAPTSSAETEVRHILKCVTSALRSVAHKDGQGGPPPVIVLNGLNSVFFTDHPSIAQTMVEWAEAVTTAGFGHVLVLCDDNVAEDLENRPTIKTSLITLEDGSQDQSAQLLRESLMSDGGSALDERQLREAVQILGGRLGDVSAGGKGGGQGLGGDTGGVWAQRERTTKAVLCPNSIDATPLGLFRNRSMRRWSAASTAARILAMPSTTSCTVQRPLCRATCTPR